jgi:YggT family protein
LQGQTEGHLRQAYPWHTSAISLQSHNPALLALSSAHRYMLRKLKLASKGHLRMNPFIWLLLTAIDIYIWIVIIMVIMSWLIAFNVLNTSNNFVRQINYALHRITEPLLGPIRRILPEMGGIDLSPLILFVGLQFLKQAIYYYLLRG